MTFVGLMNWATLLVGIVAWLVFGVSFTSGGLMMEMASALYGIIGAVCVGTFLTVRRLSQILNKIESTGSHD